MQMESNTRFIKALRYVDDYLNREAQCYCYKNEPEFRTFMDVLKSTIREREEERKTQKDTLKEVMREERVIESVIADAEVRAGEWSAREDGKELERGG